MTNISEIGLYNRPTYCENAVNLLPPALAQISFTLLYPISLSQSVYSLTRAGPPTARHGRG